MKIFISWSGELSRAVALALREWISVVLPFAEAWVSSEDIPKGSRWEAELATELNTTHCGILCLTPDNIQEPWLNFEAGALSKTFQRMPVHPFLLGVRPADLTGPLSQFQATQFTRDDVQKLVRIINDAAGAATLSKERLDQNFQTCWPDLERRVAPLATQTSGKRVGPRTAEEPEAGTSEDRLNEEDLKVLCIMAQANGKRIFPQQLADSLGVHPERAKHVMEKLQSFDLLAASHNRIHGTSWLLSRQGRAELVRRNLL